MLGTQKRQLSILSLLLLGVLLSGFSPVFAATFQVNLNEVQCTDNFGNAITCFSPLTINESTKINSLLVTIVECLQFQSSCISPLVISESSMFASTIKVLEQICNPDPGLTGRTTCSSPLKILEIIGNNVQAVVTSTTATVTQWVTTYINQCGSAGICAPVAISDTGFDFLFTSVILPLVTIVVFVMIALVAKVRSFSVLVLFGAVAVMLMAGSLVLPPWFMLVIILVLAGLTTRIIGQVLVTISPNYAVFAFLLLIGAFMATYSASVPTASQIQCTQTTSAGSLATQTCANGIPTLPCIGNILGYCIVSDIINGLTSALSIFGSLTNSPISTALTLGFIFLVVGIIAGIAGFGQLMNVVFSVGLAISIFYYVNSELAFFIGTPVIIYNLFTVIIGISQLYLLYESFSRRQ